MTHASKLGLALRKKFKTPRDALRALGLDEKLLPGGSAGGSAETLKKMRSDDEKLEKFRAFLRASGLSDNDVDEAMQLATVGGGRLSDRPQAMDAAAEARFERMFPDAARITSDTPIADQRSLARSQTSEEVERFEKMFPEARRIGLSPY